MPSASPKNVATSLADKKWTVSLLPRDRSALPLSAPELEQLESGIPATVPGNIYDALLAAGIIPDPFIGTNEQDLHWIAKQDWVWAVDLEALNTEQEAQRNLELQALGLDTIADITLGGKPVGSTENMHRTYKFDITDLATNGGQLQITFTSPYTYTDEKREELGFYPGSYEEPYNMIRKMAANYGWDWGPTVVSNGIWKDLLINAWAGAKFDSVRVATTVVWGDTTSGLVHAKGSVSADDTLDFSDVEVRVTVTGQGEAVLASGRLEEGAFDVTAVLPDVSLWWPHSLGAQPLYDVRVDLVDTSSDEILETVEKRVGFRTIEIVNEPAQTPEEALTQGRFGVVVNGVDTFAKGWNWIPNDPLVDRVSHAEYAARLADIVDSRADWVRVWGGGIFEDDAFYDLCDEVGILVWQDFPFSCASYPEGEYFEGQVKAEAEDNVERLMSHPSLGIWNGNNENFLGYEAWGWEQDLKGRGWGSKYYLEILPKVVEEVDGTRPYWPGSPYSGVEGQLDNDPNYGTTHSWEVWNRLDYSHYLDTDPTFMAEFGWQAPPAWSTLVSAIGAPENTTSIDLESPEVLNHQKAMGGMKNLARGVREHFGSSPLEDSAAWHYLTQVVQARAIFTGVGHWRSLWPRCQGAFIWQINDCWPVISWAAVDVEGRRKPMWFTAREAFSDRLLYLKEVDEQLTAFLVNQEEKSWKTDLVTWLIDETGSPLSEAVQSVEVPPATVVSVPVSTAIELPRYQLLVVEAGSQRRLWSQGPDYDFAYPQPAYQCTLEQKDDSTFELRLCAESLLRELLLQIDRVDTALWADAIPVDLLPGEEFAWEIKISPEATTADKERALAALATQDWQFPVISSLGSVLSK